MRLPLLSPDFQEREVFCCGADPFMRAVRGMLEAAGFNMKFYHQESFGAPSMEALPASANGPGMEVAVEARLPVRFADFNVDGECIAGQTVLQAARASGVRVSAACEFGLSGTCRVRKISGAVEMSHNGGILEDEIAEGYILACCSKPLSALEIEA